MDEPGGERPRARWIAATAGLALGLALVATVLVAAARQEGVDRAIRLLASEGAFDTTVKAAGSFGEVSEILRADGDECAERLSSEAHQCSGRLAAAAWSQITAFNVGGCTQRSIATARSTLHTHLQALQKAGPREEPPDLPPLVNC